MDTLVAALQCYSEASRTWLQPSNAIRTSPGQPRHQRSSIEGVVPSPESVHIFPASWDRSSIIYSSEFFERCRAGEGSQRTAGLPDSFSLIKILIFFFFKRKQVRESGAQNLIFLFTKNRDAYFFAPSLQCELSGEAAQAQASAMLFMEGRSQVLVERPRSRSRLVRRTQ